jgi:hypothetical protein
MVYKASLNVGESAYIECGADGLNSSVSFHPADVETALEQDEGYTTVPVFIGPCVMAAAIVCYYVLHGTIGSLTHQIEWMYGESGRSGWLALRTIRDDDSTPCPDDSSLPEVEVVVDDDGMLVLAEPNDATTTVDGVLEGGNNA